ncbi:DUF916 and DUF3324 domain-containing protein [Clostridia bacterium OttesenSCG-928-O13]|nr:DUF916 and DUF3324 domain-containing protein [Clostridia bacterium OttesenSCG-928-O13]
MAAALIILLLGLLPGTRVQAATAGEEDGIGFYVRAVLPENQLDDTLTYFDLRMQPGQTQMLEVEVVNEGNEAITVDVAAISASTNRNGIIDYKTPNVRDETLKHPFSDMATLENASLSIPSQGTAMARVVINMPAEKYDGTVLGGLVFTRRPEGAAPGQGMTLQNVYSYVLGVKLSETDAAVLPEFELVSIQAETVNYQPAMVHSIRNRAAAIAKGIGLHILVRDENGKVAGEFTRSGIDMAPNSVMPLGVMPLSDGEAQNGEPANGGDSGELATGNYESEITLTYEGQTHTFSQKFTVGSVEAEAANTALDKVSTSAPSPSRFLIVLLVIAGIIILALFIIIMRMLRRREETKELNRLMRQRGEQIRLQKVYREKSRRN